MKLLVSKGVTEPAGSSLDVSWAAFRDLVRKSSVTRSDERSSTKRDGKWFSCAAYRDNYRTRQNLTGMSWAIVADFDQVRNPGQLMEALAKWEYIAWTTWNSTPEKPRWRVVLPVEGGVHKSDFEAFSRRVLEPLEKYASVDPRSYMPEQLWFFPEHKRSMNGSHRIWENGGKWLRDAQIISVDFTGVRLARVPETVQSGDRNNSLVIRLGERDALQCETLDDLIELALAWNERLSDPMPKREVIGVAKKKWRWMQRGVGLQERAAAWRGKVDLEDMPEIGVGLLSKEISSAKLPDSIVGDFLYPGATLITAKMKEGKSFLAMQLAMSVATGTPFLAGPRHRGFHVHTKQKAVVVAGEDTAGGIASRFLGSIAAGHLPTLANASDVRVVFNDDLDSVRRAYPKIPGLALFESLVERWYAQGYRVIALDPLRVLEAALMIDSYPGTTQQMNAHARDFQTMRFFTKVAQAYDDLCILVSMHHGKNKRDHDASDPGDMIAGTTGFGAGAVATLSLLPIPEQLNADEDAAGLIAKRREFYVHGRHTREQRLLIEQDVSTGVWRAIGSIADEMMGQAKEKYFEALLNAGGTTRYVGAEEIARKAGAGTKPGAVHKVLQRARRVGNTYLGWRIIVKRGVGGGYRLVGAQDHAHKENM